jgi:4-hydroxyphenylpyruvate dioxygenase-like putative hemolysin
LAWTLIHGNAINHIALTHDNIEQLFNNIRKDPKLNLATELQYSEDKKLMQFSLEADKIKYEFRNGDVDFLPGYFIEFIQRIDDRDGFEVSNASKIFDSTK